MAEVQIPIPIQGLNTVNQLLPVESGFARELTNYSLIGGKLIMRPSTGLTVQNPVSPSVDLGWINLSGGVWYSIDRAAPGNIRRVSNNAGATSIGGGFQAPATTIKHLGLNLLIGAQAPRDQAYPFTAWTFTTLGITATAITSATSHKGRLYVCDGQTLEYSGVAAITGTMAGSFPLAEFLAGQNVSRIFSITTQPGNDVDNIFVIFGDGGKVLIYTGDYPGSTTWNLAGNFDMPAPISNQGFVSVDGELFVATTRYCYWLRDLVQSGSTGAYQNSPTKPIENIWQAQTWSGSVVLPEHAHAYYYEPYDAIVCQCSQIQLGPQDVFDYNNEAMCFVYFRKYNAWTLWAQPPFYAPIVIDPNTNTYYGIGTGSSVIPLIPSRNYDVFEDGTEQLIVTSWKTPYVGGFDGINQQVTGVRPYYGINSGFVNPQRDYFHKVNVIFNYSDLYLRFAFSMYYQTETGVLNHPPGQFTTGTSPGILTQFGNQFSSLINVGGVGEGFSIQFTQRDDAVARNEEIEHCIYAATVYYEVGGTQ